MTLFTTSFSKRALVLASLVALGACSKKNDDPTPTPTTTSSVTWTADNTTYSAAVTNVAVQGTDMVVTGIATSSSGNNTVSLLVPAATGTYSLAGATDNVNYLMSYNVNSSSLNATAYVASNLRNNGSGTVTVTTYSATEVAGTFSFTGDNASGGSDTKAVTNGKFSIKR
jgi:hypothetical protein